MFTSVNLPYAPQFYDRNSIAITSTSDPMLLIGRNQKRILLWITPNTPLVAISPSYSLEQSGNGQSKINVSASGELLLWWERHNILATLAVFANGFGIGTVFNVTEVYYDPLPSREMYHATRKFEDTTAKIKRHIYRQSSSVRHYRGFNTTQPK